jgi:O-acetyl-ADP-ribose deacetylase (regulator of RNase III)/predicted Ser/Thr protein kinase
MSDDRISGLIAEWERVRREGRECTIDELCTDAPELASELRGRIQAMSSLYRQLDVEVPATVVPSDTGTVVEPNLEPTALLERYEICEEVGRGAMGAVYRGRHRLLDRHVAIKVCLLDNLADRFHREAQLLASVSSPYIVAVHDFAMLGSGRAILVMDWIEGVDLEKIIRKMRGPVDEARTLRWMIQVCKGMQEAANRGIVHRDLKPSNILIDENDQARVADFGLASHNQSHRLTFGGGPMGTPIYMAPEQAEDPRGVDTRADIYSFGATFYHALTGRTPFEAKTPFDMLYKHKTEPLVSPRTLNPRLSARISELVERCLAKLPADRFSRFSDVLECLSPKRRASARSSDEDPELAPLLDDFARQRDAYLRAQDDGGELGAFQLPAGQVVRIVRGKIVDQQVDAIVSMSDDRLSLATDIRTAGGPELLTRAKELAPVRPGRAVVTAAGNLPVRFVIHGVVIGSSDNAGIRANNWVLPSRDVIAEAINSSFYAADSHRMLSLAFPVSANGSLGMAAEDSLDTLFRGIVRSLQRSLTSVREVRIVIGN